MNGIADAIMGNGDPTVAVNREVLKYAIQRQIFCKVSGRALDIRTSVLVTITTASGTTGSDVFDGSVWDLRADTVTAACAERGWTLDVIDGRIVNARKRRRNKATDSEVAS
jgi:hypothetical protein